MTYPMILGLWVLAIALLIAFAFYRDYRIETKSRGTRELAAKAQVQETNSMVCESCGRYRAHPDNSAR